MLRQGARGDSKYLKYWIVCGLVIVFGIASIFWYSKGPRYYHCFNVAFGKYDYPYIAMQLQNKECEVVVDVGSRFPLALPDEVLNTISDKQFQGMITIHNIDGGTSTVPSYVIPKLKIGELTLDRVVVHESQEDYGTLGKFLGKKFNFLLDLGHFRIVACDHFSKLQAKKITNNHWISAPFKIRPGGIVFLVKTDFGTLKLAINTTCTINYLNSSLLPANKSYVSSSISLGHHKFRNITFESIKLPDGLGEIDGFIGVDFLREHAIYFDYKNQIAYIEPDKKYFERIPVVLNQRNTPIVNISIQNNIYSAKLDLGSFISFSLCEDVLKDLHKAKYGSSTWHDFRGKEYQSPIYTIPEIKIGNLIFRHALTNQDSKDFHANVTFNATPVQFLGVVGWPILEKYNLLLDFPHEVIYASSDLLSLQEKKLVSDNLLSIPFKVHSDGIIFPVETDEGIYRLVLDTGATFTVIRAPHSDFTTKFCIHGHNFGPRAIKSLDVSPEFDFDGVLGMDFLCEHLIFIDYSNKSVFVDLQK